MSSSEKPENEKKFDPPSKEAFGSKQIDLFRTFLCNSDEQRERLSNAFPLWDCLPRYSFSRRTAEKLRKDGKLPQVLKLKSQCFGQEYDIVIQPARILDNQGNVTEYYPCGSDEIIEDALRKIATLQNNGFFERSAEPRSGVSFTLYQLQEELKKQGHSRSYKQIVLSLQILANSIIRIKTEGRTKRAFIDSPYFRQLSCVSRADLDEDPSAKWYVDFHPLITQAISAIEYRQFNYALMMSHTTQLARWLNKYLVIKFTYAQIGKSFEIRFSTVKRDSGLLDGYGRNRKAMEALKKAFQELVVKNILLSFDIAKIIGPQCEVEDIVYTIFPTVQFSIEVKASNANCQTAKATQ